MIPFSAVFAGIYGAFRLARRDPAGLAWFDASPRGFWTSFMAALIVLPAVLVLEVLDGSLAPATLTARKLAVELIGYAIGWTAFPLVMSGIADGMGKGHLWVRYVVAYNWSSVIQMAAFLPVAVLTILVPNGPMPLVNLVVTVVILVYLGYVAHVALEVPAPIAAGIVLLDVLLGGLINMVTKNLAGIPPT